MAERTQKTPDDGGQAEAQRLADQANEQGFIGIKVDPLPNEAHSLESGPEAPTAVDRPDLRLVQHAAGEAPTPASTSTDKES